MVKAGVKSTEFWLQLAKLVAGCVLAYFEETRLIGCALLGTVPQSATDYTRARTELKREALK